MRVWVGLVKGGFKMNPLRVGGIYMHYYAICKRKMWLYDRGIAMEKDFDRIIEGQILHEQAYKYLPREIMIDNAFKIDAIDSEHVREVKISSKMTEADRIQMLFYLYQLELRGIKKKGLISYTKERKTKEIILDKKGKNDIRKAIADAYSVLEEEKPPSFKKLSYCKSCAYHSFCYAREVEEV